MANVFKALGDPTCLAEVVMGLVQQIHFLQTALW